ncbi:ATP-binding protein [Candidatus Bathyarchaeota archaeon]|nr:ATP-binding protein [Candidatus Bathyarchaeota archaeon]MBL7168445.1 ATP-binding protein [Candidatus Bathyarchaeota archaeon]
MSDPRIEVIERRLEKVENIIAVSSGKGGVGKSVVASTLSLELSSRGYSVGLFDLDFTSPSTHVILGIQDVFPDEEYGIIPPLVKGLRYMSIIFYALDRPAPLRGSEISDAIIEVLAITRWEELDYLIIDMPPGMGDATLDVIRLIPRIKFLMVSTPSKVAYETVRKQLTLLRGLDFPVIGVIENMVMHSLRLRSQVEEDGAEYLGSINYDPVLEEALGDIERLKKTAMYAELTKIVHHI